MLVYIYMFGDGFSPEKMYKPEYNYFTRPIERHDVYEYSKELSNYLFEEKIPVVLFLDRSPRPLWVGIDEYWKINYSEEKRPDIFFINPDRFDIITRLIEKRAEESTIKKALQKVFIDLEEKAKRDAEKEVSALREEFENSYAGLIKYKDKPIALYDNCIHSGETFIPVAAMLERFGYSDIRLIAGDDTHDFSPLMLHKTLCENTKLVRCHPFGKNSGVMKGEHVHSDRDYDADREDINLVRQEIRKIVRNKGK